MSSPVDAEVAFSEANGIEWAQTRTEAGAVPHLRAIAPYLRELRTLLDKRLVDCDPNIPTNVAYCQGQVALIDKMLRMAEGGHWNG